MLDLIIPSIELFNEATHEFTQSKEYHIRLEHSLVSLSKWESCWEKPFLSSKNKTEAEELDYIRCMTITQNVPLEVYTYIRKEQLEIVSNYINKPMTATVFYNKEETRTSREIVTAEIIYYWMISFNIPLECQTWHLNKLLTLINVCSIKNKPKDKLVGKSSLLQRRELNAARRAKYGSSG